MNKVRRCFYIDEKIYQEFKIYSIIMQKTMSELVEEYMKKVNKGVKNVK